MKDLLLNRQFTECKSQSASIKGISILNGTNLDTQNPSVISVINDNDIFLDQSVSQCISRSQEISKRYSYIYNQLDESSRLLLRSRMQGLLSIMHRHQEIRVKDIVLDAYSESSFIVSFEDRSDLKLTINFDEPDYINSDNDRIANVEVAYLSFKSNGKRHTINNTFYNIIKQLMDMYA